MRLSCCALLALATPGVLCAQPTSVVQGPGTGRTIYVAPNAADPDEDGSVDHPFDTIQEGVNEAAMAGDTVLLLPGVHSGSITLLSGKSLTIRGASPTDRPVLEGSGLRILAGAENRIVVQNLAFTGCQNAIGIDGGDVLISDCAFTLNFFDQGGAINARADALVIERCSFASNGASSPFPAGAAGGGVYLTMLGPVTIDDCAFSDNRAGGGTPGTGGAIHAVSVSRHTPLVVRRCVFSRNEGVDAPGGAVYLQSIDADPNGAVFIGCDFEANRAASAGAVLAQAGAFLNCRFLANAADNAGALECPALTPDACEIVNASFVGNTAAERGGAIRTTAGIRLVNTTLVANTAGVGGAGDGPARFDNCILWANDDNARIPIGAQWAEPGTGAARFSCVQGLAPDVAGPGAIDLDPMFLRLPSPGADAWGDNPATPAIDESANDDYGDLRLAPGSPCIDSADNDAVPADRFDLDHDADTAEALPFDLAGAPRSADDPDIEDAGPPTNTPPVVDMGAYEHAPTACACDWNTDGFLNDSDFFDWINDYFARSGPRGTFDFNEDGAENAQDFFDFVNCYFGPPFDC